MAWWHARSTRCGSTRLGMTDLVKRATPRRRDHHRGVPRGTRTGRAAGRVAATAVCCPASPAGGRRSTARRSPGYRARSARPIP
jgi:hypothetical protein